MIDADGVRAALASAGLTVTASVSPADAGRIAAVFAKAEASPTGAVRGRRNTMLSDADIHYERHARAALGAVIASVTLDRRFSSPAEPNISAPQAPLRLPLIVSFQRAMTTPKCMLTAPTATTEMPSKDSEDTRPLWALNATDLCRAPGSVQLHTAGRRDESAGWSLNRLSAKPPVNAVVTSDVGGARRAAPESTVRYREGKAARAGIDGIPDYGKRQHPR